MSKFLEKSEKIKHLLRKADEKIRHTGFSLFGFTKPNSDDMLIPSQCENISEDTIIIRRDERYDDYIKKMGKPK